MKISKQKMWLIVTIIIGIITALLVMSYLKGVEEEAAREILARETMTTMVVAAQKIPEGVRVMPDMIKEVEVPVKYAVENAISDPEEILNKFSAVDIWSDDIFFPQKLVDEQVSNELPHKIPESSRAITIASSQVSGVAGFVKPGYYIDILLHYAPTDEQDDNKVLTLLQNVLVLAVGQDLEKKEEPQLTENITLAVTPNDAQLIMLAENTGKIKLVLRPAGDEAKVDINAINIKGLETLYPLR